MLATNSCQSHTVMHSATSPLLLDLADAIGLPDDNALIRDGVLNVHGNPVALRMQDRFGTNELSAYIDLGMPLGQQAPLALQLLVANDLWGANARLVFAIDSQTGHIMLTSRTGVTAGADIGRVVDWLLTSVKSAQEFMADVTGAGDARSTGTLSQVTQVALGDSTTAAQWRTSTLNRQCRQGEFVVPATGALPAYHDGERGIVVRHCGDVDGLEFTLTLGVPREPQHAAALLEHLLRLNGTLGTDGFVTFAVDAETGTSYVRILKAYFPDGSDISLENSIDAACQMRDCIHVN